MISCQCVTQLPMQNRLSQIIFACSMLLRGSVMKKRLSFIIIMGHCFFLSKVITDQAFQWLNYNRKEKYCLQAKSYISITGKFLWPFRNLMQFTENSCKPCKPNFKLYMCWWKCSVVIYHIYIYTWLYIWLYIWPSDYEYIMLIRHIY